MRMAALRSMFRARLSTSMSSGPTRTAPRPSRRGERPPAPAPSSPLPGVTPGGSRARAAGLRGAFSPPIPTYPCRRDRAGLSRTGRLPRRRWRALRSSPASSLSTSKRRTPRRGLGVTLPRPPHPARLALDDEIRHSILPPRSTHRPAVLGVSSCADLHGLHPRAWAPQRPRND